MNWIPSNHYSELKKEVGKTAGILRIMPADCKLLSHEILKKTNRQISVTTLKRIYGYASTRFNPSSFTLDALAEYCGYNGWNGFQQQFEPNRVQSFHVPDTWMAFKEMVRKITAQSLQLLKNRSGIPFGMTIPRKFMNEHFSIFLNEDYRCTVLTAPSGYGKTIGLCHWIEQLIQKDQNGSDTIFFLSAGNNYHILSEWLSSFSGLRQHESTADIPEMLRSHQGRFFVVIDGLDNHFNQQQLAVLFGQLNELITLYRDSTDFKIILTMRSANWSYLKHAIEQPEKWFTGFMQGYANERNVPALDYHEILDITGHKHLQSFEPAQLYLMENLTYPLYLQYFYDRYSHRFLIDQLNELSIYELVTKEVFQKIYCCANSNEIILLLTGLMDMMDTAAGNFKVDKLIINGLIKKFSKAYHMLLDIGYLVESNESNTYKYDLKICFGSPVYIPLALAKKLLVKTSGAFNDELVLAINNDVPADLRTDIIRWCIYLSIANHQPCSINLLNLSWLTIPEKLSLITFLGELFAKHVKDDPVLLPGILKSLSLDDFFGTEYIQGNHDRVIAPILQHAISPREQIMMHTCNALISVTNLEFDKLNCQLQQLAGFSGQDFLNFPVNPLHCLETIYYYFKHGIVQKTALKELTRFYTNPSPGKYPGTGFNDVLFILAVNTVSIYHNSPKLIRLIRAIYKVYPDRSAACNFFIDCLAADAHLMAGRLEKATHIYTDLRAKFPKNQRTGLMDVLLESLELKLDTIDLPPQLDRVNLLIDRCDKYSYNLQKVNLLSYLIAKYPDMKDDGGNLQDLYHNLLRTVRNKGGRPESFFSNPG